MRLFGTDGVRGVAGLELTADLAFKLGQAGAYVLTKKSSARAKILVGRDTRVSGDMLECALIAGICSMGVDAVAVGVMPTPAIAYLTREYKVDAGVVISASHNPAEYNGIKFFSGQGLKLPDQTEDEIEALINENSFDTAKGENIGKRICAPSALSHYIKFAADTIDCSLEGLKFAVDCANGAAYKVAPMCFESLGAEVLAIHNRPDGYNINKNCGSTHMDSLVEFTTSNNCDLGIAFDGDADRVLLVDKNGNIIDGDQIMAACALAMKNEGTLKQNTLVATVLSNMGLFLMGEKHGISVIRANVGDRYVLEAMIEGGYNFGGEQSGHIIFSDYNTTGDGLVSALQFLQIMVKTKKGAGELANTMNVLPQVLIAITVDEDRKYSYIQDPVITEEIERVEKMLSGTGRVLVRASGTEPCVRIMLEGPNLKVLQKEADTIGSLIKERLT